MFALQKGVRSPPTIEPVCKDISNGNILSFQEIPKLPKRPFRIRYLIIFLFMVFQTQETEKTKTAKLVYSKNIEIAPTKIEKNKETQRRIVEEVFNNKDMSVIPELISPDFAYDVSFGRFRGPEGFRQMCEMQNAAFHDLHYTIEDMIGVGDKLQRG